MENDFRGRPNPHVIDDWYDFDMDDYFEPYDPEGDGYSNSPYLVAGSDLDEDDYYYEDRLADVLTPAKALPHNYGLRNGKTRMKMRNLQDFWRDDYGPTRATVRQISHFERRFPDTGCRRGCFHCNVRNRVSRMLEISVGRPWTKVYSDLCNLSRGFGRRDGRKDFAGAPRNFVHRIVKMEVARNCYYINGQLYGHFSSSPSKIVGEYYVDPLTGNLAKAGPKGVHAMD